jgi:hypothetical protein
MSLILGANQLTAGGYEIDNSLRFNSGSSDNLSRTPSASNRKTWTFSTWIKFNRTGSNQGLLVAGASYTEFGYLGIKIGNGDYFDVTNGIAVFRRTTQLFRDVSAWYHFVVGFDTTQATDSNRVKVYVNGSQITDFSITNNPTLNTDYGLNSNALTTVGRNSESSGEFFNGYMAESYYIDGQALDPTDFGEFDSDTNIWKPIPYTGTFGTNGFYLEFKDSSALGDDTSGNGNDFTVNNLTSIDQTTDTPTNNFATLNPLDKQANVANAVFSEGNTVIDYGTASLVSGTVWGTIGVNTGKWYAEFNLSTYAGVSALRCGFLKFAATTGATKDVSATGIYMVALDLINSLYWLGTNGVWDAGDPNAGTGGTSLTPSEDFYTISVRDNSGNVGSGGTWKLNTGNPAFTISSGNADANGYGNFEYAVPSGYFALCTKNLAQYG